MKFASLVAALGLGMACGGMSGDDGGNCVVPEPPVHLAEALPVCDDVRDIDEPTQEEIDTAVQAECTRHADCADGLNGRCITIQSCDSYDIWLDCSYDDCVDDGDCGDGAVCLCEWGTAARNRCVPAECTRDGDCPGGWCAADLGPCGAMYGYFCLGCSDECDLETPCPPDDDPDGDGPRCRYSAAESNWSCVSDHGSCGECEDSWIP